MRNNRHFIADIEFRLFDNGCFAIAGGLDARGSGQRTAAHFRFRTAEEHFMTDTSFIMTATGVARVSAAIPQLSVRFSSLQVDIS